MSTPVTIDDLGATPVVVKPDVGVLETLHLKNTHANGLWVHFFDRASADGLVVGETPPDFRWFFPSAPEPEDPAGTQIPMLRANHGIVLAAVEQYFGGATGPASGALRGGAIVE
jgi:hypothetical protein